MIVSPGPASPDIAIVGGGIVGLWCAHVAAKRGAQVLLIEKRTIASGASGGMLGALMPHQPTGWNAKKQLQLDGLLSLPGRVAELEAQTALSCGYARTGRLMPIGHPEKRRQSAQWADGAAEHWPEGCAWTVEDANPAPGWMTDGALTDGVNHDTLSARIDPRRLTAALRAALETHDHVSIRENAEITRIGADGALTLPNDETIAPGTTIIAAGTGAFALVDPAEPGRVGRGVKGQGALLKPTRPVDPVSPILYDKGVYVIAHESGHIAVGSTSEDTFDAPDTTDDKLDGIVAKATALCPALEGAAIIERWAGVRPRAEGREPLVGPLPGGHNVILATGGFKISFAIAHLMADAAVGYALGGQPDGLPELFLPAQRGITLRRSP
ncbi:MAG: FAD-binding oxidoreductase [Roseitalea sp.]|jgi:glycine/D-amino acid oxidase-like deaminating enzyme|nr:FAD-binding oxidoreductase [Roseitalea sp.]MBO6722192.1 FAD-binding oxidoreductase [Roseitalea sp.]MBO6745017.1 FAD-binding oxidoreductase [Roseitalea sp.]